MLLQINAIKLQPSQPFTWASGWKSPIYCDNRISLSAPDVRTYIKTQLAALVKSEYANVDAIVGVATAGIPQGALVADLLNLPYAYVRPEPKKHGMGNQIEGRLEAGQKVVMIEDLISTGGSSLKACKPVQNMGIEVLAVLSVFDYGFPAAEQAFADAGIPYLSLSSYEQMLPIAVQNGYILSSDLETLKLWRQNPVEWGITV